MARKKQSKIKKTMMNWNGRDVEVRQNRMNLGIEINKKNINEAHVKKVAAEVVKRIPGAKLERLSMKTGRLIITVPDDTNIEACCKEMMSLEGLRYAEPDVIDRATVVPNDTRVDEQWALSKIRAFDAWDLETGQANILIGIIDSGISFSSGSLSHSDLNNPARYILGTDFVDGGNPNDGHGHGTHVAGIACAETNNGDGIAGMNWQSPVYICRVFDNNRSGSGADFADAVEEIVDFALANDLQAIINYSGGGPHSATKRDACEYAHENGMLLIAATGNDDGAPVISPAEYSDDFGGVMAVGASDEDDNVTDFSNVGPEVCVVAPGDDILSTLPTYSVTGDSVTDFTSWDGTSMATPYVSGLASLVWSRSPELTNRQVRSVIENTAVKLGPGNFDNDWGFGRIDAADAVQKSGWELTPVQTNLQFMDIPESQTQVRAVRIDVNSFHRTSLELVQPPSAPFELHDYDAPFVLTATDDYDTARSMFIWVKYTGSNPGDIENGTMRVRCPETNQTFDINITANTIAKPTCAIVVALDKSGSMLSPSGIDDLTREDVVKISMDTLISQMKEDNALGIVAFDEDADQVLHPLAGPFDSPELGNLDPARAAAISAMTTYAANPSGLTSVGDGIFLASSNLSTATSYDETAIIVLTDGKENRSRTISEVGGLIGDKVFAIGMGSAGQIDQAKLDQICNGSGGYLLLTDSFEDNDDLFKLSKYFLQIQAGLNNEDIVLDPTGRIRPDQDVRIPFQINEEDIYFDAMVMAPFRGLFEFCLESPSGELIEPSQLASYPTISVSNGSAIQNFRTSVPAMMSNNNTEHGGEWHIILKINRERWKRLLSSQKNKASWTKNIIEHGVPYMALVHAYSNINMRARIHQESYEPGAKISVYSSLNLYGIPMDSSFKTFAEIKGPEGASFKVSLERNNTGDYVGSFIGDKDGVYEILVKARGKTKEGNNFTREKLLTAAIWRGGDRDYNTHPNGHSQNDHDLHHQICKLLKCLYKSSDQNLVEYWKKKGLNIEELVKCYCSKSR